MKSIKKYYPYLTEILNAIEDGIVIADGEGTILWFNKTTEDRIKEDAKEDGIFVPRSEIIGSSIHSLEERGVFAPSATKAVLEQNKPVKILQHSDANRKRTYFNSGYPIKDKNGNIVLIVAHSHYIPHIVEVASQLTEAQSLIKRYSQEVRKTQLENDELKSDNQFIGKSPEYLSLLDEVDRIASTDTTVLITGETGVGKSVIAKRIHQLSERFNKSILEINCGAIPESLIEAELFGYVKGAFTGANSSGKAGLIQLANEGTLFLDEIGEAPLPLQVKLLQFIQEKKFLPVGATHHIMADVRIIAATNRDLEIEVEKGNFRSDLFYRLNVLPLRVPSLKEREEDIINLVHFYLDKFNKTHKKERTLSKDVMDVLQSYDWPGNIRELKNLIERLVIIAPREKISLTDLPTTIVPNGSKSFDFDMFTKENSFIDFMEEMEEDLLRKAYRKFKTTRKTAEKLGITQSLLMRRFIKYNIKRE